jgi:glycosyltransferase involved in cell wall biosynthesis
MKVSLVTTVLNEEKTIEKFLDSVISQTRKPEEVVIVDGGSTDETLEKVQKFKSSKVQNKLKIKILQIKGANRAEGRNEGIREATGEIIAIADAGCILEKDWLEEIVKPFAESKTEVVAGFYRGKAETVFEKCVVPYVLVMPDKIDPDNFLPASRSMAIRKKTWQEAGGFPEEFFDNEDYVFAKKLKERGARIVFCPKAIVNWLPRTNLKDFFKMIYRFARGDAQAGLRYPKMATVFARYLIGLICLIWAPLGYWLIGLFGYLAWAIFKNCRYVRHPLAFFYLPLLQVTADFGVMAGTVSGIMRAR